MRDFMKKSLKAILGLMFLSLILAGTVKAAVVVSYDQDKKCQNFRVTSEEKPIKQTEVIVIGKEVYGFSTQNQEIDFEQKEVKVDVMALVVLGLNKKVTATKVSINENHPDFSIFINQLNRKIFLLEEICISKKSEVISFKPFESE